MKGPRGSGEWQRRLALLAFGTLAGVGLLEGGARLLASKSPRAAWAFRDWDPLLMQFALMGDGCYRPLPGAVFHYENGTVAHENGLGYRGPEVAVPKPDGVFRIVLLGGSTSHGFGVNDGEAIDDHLRAELARRRPDRRFEVVNLGFDGYDSECDFERLKLSGPGLDPDAVVLHSGINDVGAARFDPPRRELAYPFRLPIERLRQQARRKADPSLWDRLKHWSYAARVPGLLKHRPPPPAPPLSGPSKPPDRGPDAFEANLRRTAALAAREALLLFSTPPSALPFANAPPPRLLVVDAPTTQRYRDALDARMRRVAAAEADAGRRAAYVSHAIPVTRFLDDCHLDSEGNRLIAVDFADALLSLIDHPNP